MQLQQAIRQFLEYCEIEKGHSDLTIRNYSHYLNRFLKYCADNNVDIVENIDQELVRNFRLFLNRLKTAENTELSKQTQNYHLIALRALLKYCAKADIKTLPAEKIELAQTAQRDIMILDQPELQRLMDAPYPTGVNGWRNRAIIELLFSTGLRLSELAALEREHVNLATGEFSIRGKGGKIRIVFISQRAREALANYIAKRHDTDPALFTRLDSVARQARVDSIGHRNGLADSKADLRLSVRQIERIVSARAKQVGITKPVHTHTLRHQFATDLLQSGADLRSVQTLLGHASVTTTQIYTHITNPELKEVHKKFHGKKLN